MPCTVQEELCEMLKVPREEAELWWYAEVGMACNCSTDLPQLPAQVSSAEGRVLRQVAVENDCTPLP